jgi:hypothetical protein
MSEEALKSDNNNNKNKRKHDSTDSIDSVEGSSQKIKSGEEDTTEDDESSSPPPIKFNTLIPTISSFVNTLDDLLQSVSIDLMFLIDFVM